MRGEGCVLLMKEGRTDAIKGSEGTRDGWMDGMDPIERFFKRACASKPFLVFCVTAKKNDQQAMVLQLARTTFLVLQSTSFLSHTHTLSCCQGYEVVSCVMFMACINVCMSVSMDGSVLSYLVLCFVIQREDGEMCVKKEERGKKKVDQYR